MALLKTLLPLAIAAPIAALLLWSGCGILTAPVTVPAAIAANTNFSLAGPLLDQDGNPLDSVLLSQQLDHRFWEPINGSTDTNEQRLRRFDRTYKVEDRGESLDLTFTHDGYYESNLQLRASSPNIITARYASGRQMDWPAAKNFPVVLLSNTKPEANLQHWSGHVDYSAYPASSGINLNALTQHGGPLVNPTATDPLAFPPATLYLTLTKSTPKPINSKGDIDPAEVNTPEQITFHITGENSGFLRIAPRLGFPPIQVSDAAPTSDYTPDLTFDHKRLKEMRAADSTAVLEAHEYFFFRVGDRFGKAAVSWCLCVSPNDKSITPPRLHYQLWLQPTPNETNLTSRKAQTE